MNMHTAFDYYGAAAPERSECTQSSWFGLAYTADIPETLRVWTPEDFADILPPTGEWQ
jgi:hypothetical protein